MAEWIFQKGSHPIFELLFYIFRNGLRAAFTSFSQEFMLWLYAHF